MKPKRRLIFVLLLGSQASAFAQTKILGRVVDADSNAVPFAAVRLSSLSATQANAQGYFDFRLSRQTANDYFLKSGVDLHLTVEKAGMVLLDPPDGKIRLPHNPDIQPLFRMVMVKKGSPLLARSERMLEHILRQKIQVAIEDKEKELVGRDVLDEQAQRLGLNKEALLTAVAKYKDDLRSNKDLNLRGLAALDDAQEALDAHSRQRKLVEARQIFFKILPTDESDVREGREAEGRLPKTYYNLGLSFFNEARYDSAALFFAKADSAAPKDTEKLNMLGLALYELAQYDKAFLVFQYALGIDTSIYGRNHPNVARDLSNIALVLQAKRNYDEALEKYIDALRINEGYWGRQHPNVAKDLNNIASLLCVRAYCAEALEKSNEALRIDERYYRSRNHPDIARDLNTIASIFLEEVKYEEAWENSNDALRIDESYFGRDHPSVARDLNTIASVLRAKGNYDGALEKYSEALRIDESHFGRNHPKVARDLNSIASVLEAKKDYPIALEKYSEALNILKQCFGPDHPHTQAVYASRARVVYASLDKTQLWQIIHNASPAHLNDTLSQDERINLLNRIGLGYIWNSKGDSALIYLEQALQFTQHVQNQKMLCSILNNLGTAYKLLKKWDKAKQYFQQSIKLYRETQGDSTLMLAYTYFHLAGVAQAEGQINLSREYAQKSLALAERHKLAELRAEVEAFLKQKR